MCENAAPKRARSAREIVAVISGEVAELATIAKMVDRAIGEIDISSLEPSGLRHLQRVDALFQHLEDLAKILTAMSDEIDPVQDFDTERLCVGVTLDHLKRRILNGDDVTLLSPNQGQVRLF